MPYQKRIFFTPQEIWNKIRKLPNQKAPGPDKIPNSALKTLISITNIFNSCLRLEYFPRTWKHSTLIMLPKPGKNLRLPSNYRPIALLNTMAKTLESLILDRLKITILPKIRPEQFGFRTQHSTTAQLSYIINSITNNLNARRHCILT